MEYSPGYPHCFFVTALVQYKKSRIKLTTTNSSFKYPGFKRSQGLTFSLVQLLLHNLDGLFELQHMIVFCLRTQLCQELVPILTPLQKFLHMDKDNKYTL